ncbi:MAG: enolase C-terminal domain-like protein [Caldilineaceae bacterium]
MGAGAQHRNAVSNDFRIGIECHFRFNCAAMEQICYALEPYNIYFIEEVLRAPNYEEIKRLSEKTRIPIVGSGHCSAAGRCAIGSRPAPARSP